MFSAGYLELLLPSFLLAGLLSTIRLSPQEHPIPSDRLIDRQQTICFIEVSGVGWTRQAACSAEIKRKALNLQSGLMRWMAKNDRQLFDRSLFVND